ncbi:MAG: D-lysine 5,6-aminomutase subunit alpha [Bdellovibrionaceae bacterium]|nr:hypothetical protein [Bdellovibrionales bacterium]MCB9254928.1 D-lysine 5,6-aminomutase subunit alpha [Pseudobdellovibrionaceae bacterium]
MAFSASLPLSKTKIARCRAVARSIGDEVAALVRQHSTVGVERTFLRLLGLNSATQQEEGLLYPTSNFIVDQVERAGRLEEGSLYWIANAMLSENCSLGDLEAAVLAGKLDVGTIEAQPRAAVLKVGTRLAREAVAGLRSRVKNRAKIKKALKDPAKLKRPLLYQIVATGNIYEDVLQAKSAVMDGIEIVAVIRSTAQSLLDYIPQGATTEGFGGTYATQENFRIMRAALDEVGAEQNKYIRLTNYASGLCMAEISLLASIEGLDCLLNDAMYGILFRDINPIRTLVDQHFSRLLCAQSGIWIMTGEDNYMKTTDAVKSGDSVLASEFINERTALNAGLPTSQMALGHAMEMNPQYEKVILMELARAQMTRQIFPESPLKYMCNTKYKTGDILSSHVVDAVFNLLGAFTNQGVLLLGMPTEAVHTPWLSDRSLSARNAQYIVNGAAGMGNELGYRSDGFMATFAQKVLDDAVRLLEKIEKLGFLKAIERGYFADVKRPTPGGKGAKGVFKVGPKYFNPFYEMMGSRI